MVLEQTTTSLLVTLASRPQVKHVRGTACLAGTCRARS